MRSLRCTLLTTGRSSLGPVSLVMASYLLHRGTTVTGAVIVDPLMIYVTLRAGRGDSERPSDQPLMICHPRHGVPGLTEVGIMGHGSSKCRMKMMYSWRPACKARLKDAGSIDFGLRIKSRTLIFCKL